MSQYGNIMARASARASYGGEAQADVGVAQRITKKLARV